MVMPTEAASLLPSLLTQAPPADEGGGVYLFLLICLNWYRSRLAGAIFFHTLGRGSRYSSTPAQATHPSTPLHDPPDGASCRAGTILLTHRTPGLLPPSPQPASCGHESPRQPGDAGRRLRGCSAGWWPWRADMAAVPPPHHPAEPLGLAGGEMLRQETTAASL